MADEYRPIHGGLREGYCKAEVWERGGFHSRQCTRRAKKDGWCKTHHPEAEAERQRKSNERFDKNMAESRARASWLDARLEAYGELVRLMRGAAFSGHAEGTVWVSGAEEFAQRAFKILERAEAFRPEGEK